jgi:hypothetical protein
MLGLVLFIDIEYNKRIANIFSLVRTYNIIKYLY